MPRKPVIFLDKIYKTQGEFELFVKKVIYDDIGLCNDVKNTHTTGYTTFSSSLASDIAALEAAEFDLDFSGDSGSGTITNAETMNFRGAAGSDVSTTVSGNVVEIDVDGDSLVTTSRVQSAGALMDSEVTNLDAVKNFDPTDYASATQGTTADNALPASAVSAFGLTLIDDANASAARTTLGVDAAGTDNSTDVTLAGSYDYLTISGQVITLGQVDASTDISGLGGAIDTRLEGNNVYSGSNLALLNAIDQDLNTAANVNFNDLTVAGDLVVNGTTTTINTSNLEVEDRFIFVNAGSGSVSPVGEGGIIVEGTSANSGTAFYHDSVDKRWAVNTNAAKGAIALTAEAFMSTVFVGTTADATAGGWDDEGNITIDGEDIYIWS